MTKGRGSVARIGTAAANEIAVSVTRLDRAADPAERSGGAGETSAVDAMSREAFAGTGMMLSEELARPWSRVSGRARSSERSRRSRA